MLWIFLFYLCFCRKEENQIYVYLQSHQWWGNPTNNYRWHYLLRRRSRIKLHWQRLCHLCLKSYLVVTGSSPTGSPWAQNKSRATIANFDFLAHLVLRFLYNFVLALNFLFYRNVLLILPLVSNYFLSDPIKCKWTNTH